MHQISNFTYSQMCIPIMAMYWKLWICIYVFPHIMQQRKTKKSKTQQQACLAEMWRLFQGSFSRSGAQPRHNDHSVGSALCCTELSSQPQTDSALCHFLRAADVTLELRHAACSPTIPQTHHSHDEIIQYTHPLLGCFNTVNSSPPNIFSA